MVRTFRLASLLLLTVISLPQVKAQVGISTHDTSVVSGTKFALPVYVDSSLTGKGVTSYQLQISYNTYYMAFDTVIVSGSLTQTLGSADFNILSPGTLTLAAAGSTPLAGKGILVYLRFRLLNPGDVSVSFSGGTSSNFLNEGDPPVILSAGAIHIAPALTLQIYPAGALLAVGDQVQFNAYSGTGAYHWWLTNPAVASIDSSGLLTARHVGFTKVIARDDAGTIDTAGGSIEVRPFRLFIRDTSNTQGQTLNVPLCTTDLSGLNVTSGFFQVQFNPSIITPTGVIQGGTLLSSYPAPAFNLAAGGMANISFAGSTPLNGSGILLYLQCKVSKENSGYSIIAPANILFNEDLAGDSTSATFQAISLTSFTLSPATAKIIVGDTLRFTPFGGTPPYSWSTSDSTVATISAGGLLTALKSGTISVRAADIYGGNGSAFPIEIYAARVSLADTVAVIGDTVDVPVALSPVTPSMHVQSLQSTIAFDSSVVHLLGLISNGSITASWAYSTNVSGNQIAVAAAGSSSLTTAGILFKLRFVVPPYAALGAVSNLTIVQFLLNEGAPTVMLVNGSIRASSVGLPAPPSGLTAAAVSSGRIDLTWRDNATNETGYIVDRRTDTLSNWAAVANLSANTTSVSDYGVADGSKYYYSVYSVNFAGNSSMSNVASAVTPMQPPTNLTVQQLSGAVVGLTWQDNSSSENGYYIERKLGTAGVYAVIDSVPTNASTYSDTSGMPGNTYFYRVRGYNGFIRSGYSNEVNMTITGVKSSGTIPDRFDVLQNYPNPFNPATTITYQLPLNCFVTMKIYDMLGKEVQTLVNRHETAGIHTAVFFASSLPSGVYLCRMQAGNYVGIRKLILMK
ncbi:MAG TPA: cohesin domain-containing protein [Bacteroidota bacterium]|nr:cohesin domain-containing protein [Bacteroidota bacterium]